MSEELVIPQHLTKPEKYKLLLQQIEGLIEGEQDIIANLSNIIAALKQGMNWLWVGVYFVKRNINKNADELIVGPYQGPVACSRIGFGKGVCGKAWKDKKVIIVEDVNQFAGHIACNSLSKSEIVLPAFKNGEVTLVLDIDSDAFATFDTSDETGLLQIIRVVENFI